jgi:type II secretory pathway pseudopilin PulG
MRRPTKGKARLGTRGPRGAARRNRVLALAILAVLGLATLAPAGQASEATRAEHAAQRALQAAQRTAQREAVRLQREAEQHARRAAKAVRHTERVSRYQAKVQHRLEAALTKFADVNIECTRITIEYHGFTAVTGKPNVVTQTVFYKEGHGPPPTVTLPQTTFSFESSEATTVIPIAAPLGEAGIVVRGRFDSNGVKGGYNVHLPMNCPPNPAFTIETLQSTGGVFTTGTLPGTVGQTVDYESLVTNTGNTPLMFTGFSDPGCDGMVAGGASGVVGPRSHVTFVCAHALTAADGAIGFFANAASVTGAPEAEQGAPVTRTSTGVLVSPIAPGEAKEPEKAPPTGTTGKEITAAAAPAAAGPGKSGVLSFSSSAIPSLLGPARCVRGAFTVSVKSAGVANVTFYIDRRRLARRTAHSARKGLISIRVDAAKLKAGTHHLSASITMVPGSPTAKAVVGSRTRVVRRCALAKHA